ncbi:hypothetical protein LCGC14_2501140, partial [marine sediment metagenome]
LSENSISFGQALQLDGTNDYVSLAAAESQLDTLTSAYTIEAWFKIDQFTAVDQTILSKGWIWSIHRDGSGNTLVFDAGWETTSTTNVNDGNWHHVAVTNDSFGGGWGGRRAIYIDGVLEGSDTLPGSGYLPTNDVTALIGADTTGPSKYFEGSIDEVRVWNTVRSGFDIQRTMTAPLVGNEVGLIAYYDFDDGTADDQTANSGDGVLVNGPTFAASPFSPIGYVEVQLSGEVTADPGMILNYSLTGSTAIQGTDFYSSQLDMNTTDGTPPINAIFIAKGETTGRIYFSVLPDALDENTETITITLTPDTDPFGVGSTSYTVGAAAATTTTTLRRRRRSTLRRRRTARCSWCRGRSRSPARRRPPADRRSAAGAKGCAPASATTSHARVPLEVAARPLRLSFARARCRARTAWCCPSPTAPTRRPSTRCPTSRRRHRRRRRRRRRGIPRTAESAARRRRPSTPTAARTQRTRRPCA